MRTTSQSFFDWGGAQGIAAEELVVFPGMDELFALAEVQDQVSSGAFDTIVVDCAPTAETLRLLSLPDALGWYMEKLFPLERRVAKVVRPVLKRVMSMPLPSDAVFQAGEGFYGRIEGIRTRLSTPEITSARLVMNLEKMVVAEARRTTPTRAVRIRSRCRHRQSDHSRGSHRSLFQEVARGAGRTSRNRREQPSPTWHLLRLRLFDEEMVGVDKLRMVGDELYADLDPTAHLAVNTPFRVFEQDDEVILALWLPLVERGEVDGSPP